MPHASTILATGFAVIVLLLLPVLARRILRMPRRQLMRRLQAAALPRWQVRLVLAGVGWGVSGIALATGILLMVAADATQSRTVELLAIAVGVVWIVTSLLATCASVSGRPRWLLLPQIRHHDDWSTLPSADNSET